MTTPPDPSPERRDPDREEPPARPANPPYGTSPGYGSYGGTPTTTVPGGGTSTPSAPGPAAAPRPDASPAPPSAPAPATTPPSGSPAGSSPAPATTPITRPPVTEPRTEPTPPKPAMPPAGSSLGDAPPAAKIRTGPTATSPNAGVAQSLRTTGKPRRAKLVVRRLDPWSVLKFSLLFSICLLIVFVVAVAALYYALDSLGVFEAVNTFVRDITQAGGPEGRTTGGFDLTISPDRVIGGAAVIGAINVVIITAISTLAAFLYNLCSDIVGGIEVTLAERD